jgi:hypothetical protein
VRLRRVCAAAAVSTVGLIAGCGGGSDGGTTTRDEPAGATPKQLTKAYGEIVGICIATSFSGGPEFEERDQIRTYLQQITETAEVAPDTEAEGMTAEEILFDVIPTLKECDEGLALEAESAVGKL